MKVQPISAQTSGFKPLFKCQPIRPLFRGYHSVLKDMFRKGQLPKDLKGLYGDELTQETVSVEHLIPKCKGGRTTLENTALASKRMNNLRNAKPIKDFLTKDMLEAYCKKFEGLQIGKFNGHKYVEGIKQTLKDVIKCLS